MKSYRVIDRQIDRQTYRLSAVSPSCTTLYVQWTKYIEENLLLLIIIIILSAFFFLKFLVDHIQHYEDFKVTLHINIVSHLSRNATTGEWAPPCKVKIPTPPGYEPGSRRDTCYHTISCFWKTSTALSLYKFGFSLR